MTYDEMKIKWCEAGLKYLQTRCSELEQDNNKLRELAESDMTSIQELSETIDILRQAYIENDKKWQADYDNLLVKYELTVERILEK